RRRRCRVLGTLERLSLVGGEAAQVWTSWRPGHFGAVGEGPLDGGGYYSGDGIAHWNGSHWHYVKAPIFRGPRSSEIDGVLDLGPRDVWTVRDKDIDHYDGRKWRVTPGPAPAKGIPGHAAIAGLRQGRLY